MERRVTGDKVSRRRKYAPRSRVGCLPCRKRRKRCPGAERTENGTAESSMTAGEMMQDCTSCLRLNIECIWDSKKRLAGISLTSTSRCEEQQPPPSPHYPSRLTPQPAPIRSPQFIDTSYGPVDQKTLMSYYIHSFVPSISVANIPTNFFTSVYVPMAFQSEAILDCIMACASAHLAKTAVQDDSRSRLLAASASRQARCHRFLQQRSNQTGAIVQDQLECITVILLLVGLDVQNGVCTNTWVDQLQHIRDVIRRLGGRSAFCRISWEAECIYQHFLYHDIMSIVMTGVMDEISRRDDDDDDDDENITNGNNNNNDNEESNMTSSPLVSPATSQFPWDHYTGVSDQQMSERSHDETSITAELSTLPNNHHHDTIHPLLGLSRDTFYLIQKITRVSSGRGRVDEGGEEDQDITTMATTTTTSQTPATTVTPIPPTTPFLTLERELSNLRFDSFQGPQSAFSKLDPGSQLDLLTLAETYRLAALLLLYRRRESLSSSFSSSRPPTRSSSPSPIQIARQIISLVDRIPCGNAAEAGLTFPLFLAGAELTSEGDIVRCARKLISVRRRVPGIMNIQAAEAVLEEVWRERLNGEGVSGTSTDGGRRGWEEVLKELGWVINLG